MDKRYTSRASGYGRSESTANTHMLMAAKRTPAQQDAALVAAMQRAEILRRLGV